jgi:hypothetical protein
MTRLRASRLVLAALAVAVATACSEAPDSKLAASAPSLSAGSLAHTQRSAGRHDPLAHALSRSIDVDHKGGSLAIPEVGFRLTIPKNAIRANRGTVHITVTALPGRQLAYEFEPSGITFDQPLQFEQDLDQIAPSSNVDSTAAPQVSYFKSTADLDPASGVVRSYEDLPTGIDATTHTLRAGIWHFSGYIVSWGRR